MIKFFRKIRYELMEKNKTGKYLKYAIGEIVLVVIGIVIALQLNNWNEGRKIKQVEQNLLKDLKVELLVAISDLKTVIDSHNANLEATTTLRSLIRDYEETQTVDPDTLDRLFREMDHNMTYDPRLGTLKSVIASGKTDYISNKDLRYKLSSLGDLIVDTNESTNEIQINRPLLYWSTVNKYWERKADLSMNYNFEKLTDDSEFIWWLGWLRAIRIEGQKEEDDLLLFLEDLITIIDLEIEH